MAPVNVFVLALLSALVHNTHALGSEAVLTTMTSPDYGISLTIRCDVPVSTYVQSIEIGRGQYQPASSGYPYYNQGSSTVALASIGTSNEIRNNLGGTVGVEGHLDPSLNLAYLSLTVHNLGCQYDGSLYCKVTSYGNVVNATNTNFTLCAKPANIAVRTPDVSKPLNVVIRCDVNETGETSVEGVTSITLTRNVANSTSAYVDSKGTTSTLDSSVVVTGMISTSDPSQSYLEAEFTDGRCSYLGEYKCTLLYTTSVSGSNQSSLAVAKTTTDNVCNSNCLQATSSFDPVSTRLTLSCSGDQYSCFRDSSYILKRETSLLLSGAESQLYFFSSQSTNVGYTISAPCATRGARLDYQSSSGPTFNLNGASCQDAGQTYRCKIVYWDTMSSQVKVYLADTLVPPCDPGALMTSSGRTVTCRPDPDVISSPLVSLEISMVTELGRTVLALLDPYLNNGNPIDESAGKVGIFRLSGDLDPSDPSASYLNLTSNASAGQGHSVVTSCVAVYQIGGISFKKAFADILFDF